MPYKSARREIETNYRDNRLSVFELLEEMTLLADRVVKDILAKLNFSENDLCVMALGGYARRQMFPWSDLDILILHQNELTSLQKEKITDFTALLWDSGAQPGIQLADIGEIKKNIDEDDIIRTSYVDNRFLGGCESCRGLFEEMIREQVVRKGRARFLSGKITSALRRARDYSDSLYRLEPNLKEGKGGLRDINTIWWIASVYYDVPNFSELRWAPFFNESNYNLFIKAVEFIFTIRFELHLEAKRKYDILRRDYQVVMAERLGFKDSGRYRGVENFMREYYLSARVISDMADKAMFVVRMEILRPRSKGREIHRLPGGILSYDRMLSLPRQDTLNMEKVFLLIRQSTFRSQKIHPVCIEYIKANAENMDDSACFKWGKDFGSLLGNFPHTFETADLLLKTGILEAFIPEFSDILCRMQYNTYHHYTVDEHTFLALAVLDRIASREDKYSGQYAEKLDNFSRRDLLGLSVLLHDIGKGSGKIHSESGAEMVKTILPRLGYTEEDTDTVSRVVLQHLSLSHVSQRRDLHNREEITNFVRLVETPVTLDILYLLTYADMSALGGRQLSSWNIGLMKELYEKAREVFAQQGAPHLLNTLVSNKRGTVLERLSGRSSLEKAFQYMDDDLVYALPAETLIYYTKLLSDYMAARQPVIEFKELPEFFCWQLTVCTKDEPGLFRGLAGALSACHCNILGAHIYTVGDMVVDSIEFEPSGRNAWQKKLVAELKNAINRVDYKPVIKYAKEFIPKNRRQGGKVKVVFDNNLSSLYTVLDIFAADRIGLLYDILGVFLKFGVQVRYAKISTDLDGVVDSFSVTDSMGSKIRDELFLKRLKEAFNEISPDILHR